MTETATKAVAALNGELLRDERGPVATGVLTVTGILPAMALVELFGRLVLKYRRTVKATYDGHAFVLDSEVVLLGRTLRKERWFAGADVLLRRQEAHPQLAVYTGILSVLAGSYLGIRLVWDGVRSASFSAIGLGVLFLVIGLALDYALLHLLPKGRVRFCISLTNVKKTARIGVATEAEADAFVAAVTATRVPAAPLNPSATEAAKAQSTSPVEAPAPAHPEAARTEDLPEGGLS